MLGTTNTGIATAGPEKREPEVATVLPQDSPGEREEHGPRRSFGWYQRLFLVPLIALAVFGVVSAAAPRDAQAEGTGYYWTNHGGVEYECWWIYYGNDVWYEDGCVFYYGGQHPAYYEEFSTGNLSVWHNQRWMGVNNYWNNYSSLSTVVGPAENQSGFSLLMQQIAAMNGTVAWGSSTSSSSASNASTSEGPGAPTHSVSLRTTEAAPEQEAPEQEVSSTAEVSSTGFPWKVCQDDGNCFRYGGTAWKKVNTSKAQGGSYRVSSSKSRGAFFAATGPTDAGGSTMKLITNTGPTMGKAKVLVVNLANAKVVKTAYFDLRTSNRHYKVAKSITGLTPHKPYGLVVLSANGRPVAVDAVGYEAHGNMCHNVVR